MDHRPFLVVVFTACGSIESIEERERIADDGKGALDEAWLYAESQGGANNNPATPPGTNHPLVPNIRTLIARCTDDTIYNHDVNDCDDFANRLAACVQRNGGEAGTIRVQCGSGYHRISYVCSSNTAGQRVCCAVEPQNNQSNGTSDPIIGCQQQTSGVSTTPTFGPEVAARVCFGRPGTIIAMWPGPYPDETDESSRTCSQQGFSTCTACAGCCWDKYRTNPHGSWLDQCYGWCKDALGGRCPGFNWGFSWDQPVAVPGT